MKAVITVIGKDSVGLISNMSAVCAECHVNIVDITQNRMNKKGKEMGLEVHTMHEDIFNAMHKI